MVPIDFGTGLFLIAAGLFCAVTALLSQSLVRRLAKAPIDTSLAEDTRNLIFRFDNSGLIDATPQALTFVGAPLDRNKIWEALCTRLGRADKGVIHHLNALHRSQTPFRCLVNDTSGALTVSGKPADRFLEVSVERNVQATDPSAELAYDPMQELATHREVSDKSPVLEWRMNSAGAVTWTNPAYMQAHRAVLGDADQNEWPLQAIFQPMPLSFNGPLPTMRRMRLERQDDGNPMWFETCTYPAEGDDTLHFAIHANPVVKAEEALRSFVQTLTKTFAHLPIGLAIFDRNRKLALFNPALSDLTGLEPEWLTGRPDLQSFLDRLRDRRQMPEPKDYSLWRDEIAQLVRGAEDGTYCENWPLPSGRTYQVTGRPHPEGAVAFLIEDITATVALERKFRTEVELGQSVLDHISDAVAVFARDGLLTISNQAFADLWGFEPATSVAPCSIQDATVAWREKCQPSPYWAELRDFVTHLQDREAWSVDLQMINGLFIAATFSPIAGGATLCRFERQQHIEARNVGGTKPGRQAI